MNRDRRLRRVVGVVVVLGIMLAGPLRPEPAEAWADPVTITIVSTGTAAVPLGAVAAGSAAALLFLGLLTVADFTDVGEVPYGGQWTGTKTYAAWAEQLGNFEPAPRDPATGAIIPEYPLTMRCERDRWSGAGTAPPLVCGLIGWAADNVVDGSVRPSTSWLVSHGYDTIGGGEFDPDVDDALGSVGDYGAYVDLLVEHGADTIDELVPAGTAVDFSFGITNGGAEDDYSLTFVLHDPTWAMQLNTIYSLLGRDRSEGHNYLVRRTSATGQNSCQYGIGKYVTGQQSHVFSSATNLPCPDGGISPPALAPLPVHVMVRVDEAGGNRTHSLYINGSTNIASNTCSNTNCERGSELGSWIAGDGTGVYAVQADLPDTSALYGLARFAGFLGDSQADEQTALMFAPEIQFPTYDPDTFPIPDPEQPAPTSTIVPPPVPSSVPTPTTVPSPTTTEVPDNTADPDLEVEENNILRRIGQILTGIPGAIAGAIGWLGDVLTNLFGWLIDSLWDMFEWLVEWLKKLFGELIDALWASIRWLADQLVRFLQAIQNLLQRIYGLMGWVVDLLGQVVGWLQSILDAIVTGLGEIVAWLIALPGAILDGLAWVLTELFVPDDIPTDRLVDTCVDAFPCSWIAEAVASVDAIGDQLTSGDACGPRIAIAYPGSGTGHGEWAARFPSPPGCSDQGVGSGQAYELFGYRSAMRSAFAVAMWLGVIAMFVRQLPWARHDDVPGEAIG